MTKRFFAALLCFALLMTLLPGTALAATVGPFAVTGGASPGDYAFTDGGSSGTRVLTVKTGTRLTVSGNTTTDNARIAIAGGVTAYLTLSGVEIDRGNVYPRNALELGTGSTLHLTIEGDNELTGSDDACGIRVPTGATLIISGNGVLRATGNLRGAGIGGAGTSANRDCGNVTINGGTVTATGGGGGGAGIGGSGYWGGTGGSVTIHGGTVTASGGIGNGAGIGGGGGSASINGGNGGSVTINGGTVTAAGGTDRGTGAGIGGGGGYGGNGGDGATVVITGGTVYATGCQVNSGAGGSIGGGMWTDDSGRAFSPGALGTVKNSSAITAPSVYLTTLTLDGAGDVPVSGFVTKPGYFGMTDVRALSGKLYFYLPVNTAVSAVQTGGTSPQTYQSGATAIQTNASGTAAGTLTLPVAPSITVTPAAGFAQGGAPTNLTLRIGSAGSPPNSAAHFGSLEISTDGTSFSPVAAANYALSYGSIHIALTQSYLNTLTPGTYTLRVNLAGTFAGTSLTTQLNVLAPTGADVPKTGDSALPGLWLGLMLAAGAVLTGRVVRRRRKRA